MKRGFAPLRVGFFSNHAVVVGGGELSFIDLVDAIRVQGVDPVVFVPGEGEVYELLRDRALQPQLYRLPPIRPRFLPQLIGSLIGIIGMLTHLKIDIAHINGARSMLLVGMAARLCGIPAVWHVRVMERDRLLDRLRSLLATEIVVNSRAAAKTIEPLCRDKRRIHVVYNGIDTCRFSSVASADLRQTFPLFPSLPVVLAVGRLCAAKRFHILIEACALLCKGGPPLNCLILGRDAEAERSYVQELRKLPERLELDNIVFGGARHDVAAIMKSSTLLVLPSEGEAFGRVIVEAWACGLPVVAADSGGPAEIIEREKTGLLVPVDEPGALAGAISMVLSNAELRRTLAENGRVRAENFSIEAHVRSVASIYKLISQG